MIEDDLVKSISSDARLGLLFLTAVQLLGCRVGFEPACLDCDCTADCTGLECGPDPLCGGSCGNCIAGETCWTGHCVKGEWMTITAKGRSFIMGSVLSEPGHDSDEIQHLVTFTNDFEIWSVEVTQEWYRLAMGYNPSRFSSCGDDCPVETVNWHEAAAFANVISKAEGLSACYACTGTAPEFICDQDAAWSTPYDCPGYRLSTEAEWEYAAKAGTTESTYNGTIDSGHLLCEQPNAVLDGIAWFCGNSEGRIHEAATRAPNGWGLYDMLGNDWEWGHEWYGPYGGDVTDPVGPPSGVGRIVRGCSFYNDAGLCRASKRAGDDHGPEVRGEDLSFRVLRSLERR